jgi:hypothetical protein
MFIARDTFIELFIKQLQAINISHLRCEATLCDGTWALPLGRCAE